MPIIRTRKNTAFRHGGLTVLLLFLACVAWAADTEEATFEPQHRSVKMLLPLARTAMAGGGRADADIEQNVIILTGTASAINRARRLLAAKDQPPRTLVLGYQSVSLAELRSRRIAFQWGKPPSAAIRAAVVMFADGTPQGSDEFKAARRAAHAEIAGTLRLLEGEEGRIFTTGAIPIYMSDSADPSALVSVGSGFALTPRVRGNGIVQIDVAPFDETLDSAAANRLATYQTTVIVHPGRTVIFTALNDAKGEKDMSKRGDALLQDRVLLVTVDLE
jgi:hypothetical protein